MSEYDGEAVLSNKRALYETYKLYRADGRISGPQQKCVYIVDVTCSLCGHADTLAYAGWCGIVCQGCGKTLERRPYTKKNVLQVLAEKA